MKIIKQYKELSVEKKLILSTTITFVLTLLWSIGKVIIGFIVSSFFLLASAFFSLTMCFSRYCCLSGIKKDVTMTKKRYISLSSGLIILAGLLYGIYNIRLLFGYMPTNYGLILSIAIATFSFTFLVSSIINLIKYRKYHNIYFDNLKIVSFIGALTDIMLTQMSLLMVEDPNINQLYNVIVALVISLFTIILGLVLFIKNLSIKN